MGTLLLLPTYITRDEADFGFVVRATAHGRCVVAALHEGLLAVKARADDGSVEYRVCNADLAQLYTTAASLDELRRRFDAGPPLLWST